MCDSRHGHRLILELNVDNDRMHRSEARPMGPVRRTETVNLRHPGTTGRGLGGQKGRDRHYRP
jgi:hypothetical protein